MTITAKKEEIEYTITPSGNHVGRIYQIVHIGTIPEEFEGKESYKDKVRITFELPHETHEFKEGEGEKPFSISQEYTVSMNEKAKLRQHIESMLGCALQEEEASAFEVTDLIGKVCMVNVSHKTSKTSGRKYAYISSLAPLPKGMEEPESVNEQKILDFNDNWSVELFETLPEFIREKIKGSREYKMKFDMEPVLVEEEVGEEQVADGEEDELNPEDVPF